MKIRTIRLVNFRNFADRTFTLGDRTFLAGLNGAGKSTVIDAISWGLRGVCRGTDARGAGSKDLIRMGADEATVQVDLGEDGLITRTVGRNGSSTSSAKSDAILARLGVTDAALEACLYGRAFFALHHKEAKDLLLKVLDVRIPADAIPGVDLQGRPADLDTLDLLFKSAFDNRAAAKKALAAVALPDLPKVVPLEHDSAKLSVLATAARTTERQAAANLSALTTELHQVVQARQKLVRVNVDELAGKRGVHEKMLRDETQKSVAAAAVIADLSQKAGLSQSELGARIQDRKTLILKVQAHDPERGCVLNPAIPCLTDAKLFAAQVKDLKAQVKALEADVKAGAALASELAQAQQAKADADRAVVYHQGQIAQVDAALEAADDTDRDIGLLDADKARLERAVADAKMAQDEAIIRSGSLATDAQNAAAYQTALQARQAAEDKRDKLAADVERLEALVTLLGPKGVRASALQDAVADFEGAINAGLDGFGFKLAIQAEPWEVAISRDGVTFLPFDLLSDGEKLWTGVAFQQALAAVTGLGFLAVDATETVVGLNRAMLTRVIMLSPVDQIVIAMAKGEGESLPEIDGLTVIPVSTPGDGPA